MEKVIKNFIPCFLLAIVAAVLTAWQFEIRSSAEVSGDYEYSIDSDGAVITKYNGSDETVTIPSELNGYPVTSIGDYAFRGCSLTGITIPNSVTSIGDSAFFCCPKLTSVTLNRVTSIGNLAFGWCNKLTDVIIPDSVISIGENAFVGCPSLTGVTIPDSVVSIGGGAFSYCSGVTNINVSVGNKYYSSVDGVLFNKDKTQLCCFPAGKQIKSYTIPDNVTSIYDEAFSGENLTSITIPDNVTSIGKGCFYGCSALTNIEVSTGNKYYSSIDGVLFNKDKTQLCCVPHEKKGSYVIPNSVKSIDDYAFWDCHNLVNITIPNSVTSIGDHAFGGCDSLTSITIPSSIISINKYAFFMCSSLTSVTISSGVTSIGDSAFQYCSSLTNITIPSGVTSIGDSAFENCSSLTNITIPNSVTSIGDYAFWNCSSLTNITIPSGVASIGDYAFVDCSSLTNINIPNSVTSIGMLAFFGCDLLTDVYYSGSEAQWKKITIKDGNECLTDAVIHYNCSSATVVSAPTNVKATAGDKQIKLTWTAVSGATKYRVQRLNDSKWGTIATISTNSYTNTGLTNGTKYSYRVLASADGSTWSGTSAVVSATPAAAVKVSTPTNVKATAGDKQIKLTWTAVSGATKYRVQRLNDSKWGTIATICTNSYTNTGLTNGTKYSYRVLASADGSTWSSASAVVSATPAAAVKVSAPTNVSATAGNGQVKLTWTAVSGATKYRVQRLNDSKWGTIATVSTNSYTNTGLTNGTKYSYRVLASADGSTWSSASAVVSATPAATVKVSSPTNVKATAGDKQIKLTWTAVSGATKYRVQRLNGSTWGTITTVSTNSYTNTGLTNGTKYSYRVLASADGSTWSGTSAVASATPAA